VIERDFERFLIKSSYLVKYALADDQAGRCDCADILDRAHAVELTGTVSGRKPVAMYGQTSKPEIYPGMLDSAVWVKQFGADTTNLRPHSECDHFLEPIIANDFNVVVEKSEYCAARLPRGEVVKCRVIERPRMR